VLARFHFGGWLKRRCDEEGCRRSLSGGGKGGRENGLECLLGTEGERGTKLAHAAVVIRRPTGRGSRRSSEWHVQAANSAVQSSERCASMQWRGCAADGGSLARPLLE
jgi:hypothetical protein